MLKIGLILPIKKCNNKITIKAKKVSSNPHFLRGIFTLIPNNINSNPVMGA